MSRITKSIRLEDSYTVWSKLVMTSWIMEETTDKYNCPFSSDVLRRSWRSMYKEWYLHNIGYWITLPFTKIGLFEDTNEKCKNLVLKESVRKK